MNTMKKTLALFLAASLIPWAGSAQTAAAAEDTSIAVEDSSIAVEDSSIAVEDSSLAVEDSSLAAEDAAPDAEGTAPVMEARTYPYLRTFDDEEIVEDEMTLYFFNGEDIPYSALSEYMPFFASLMKDYDEWDDVVYEIERIEEEDTDADSYWVSRTDNDTTMIVLPQSGEIWFDSYNLFMNRPGVTSLVSALDLPEPEEPDIVALMDEAMARAEEMEANGEEVPEDYYDDIVATVDPAQGRVFFTNAGGSFNRHGKGTYLDLSEYAIAFYSVDGECYIPFQTLNDLFMNQQYLQFIFNGQTVIGAAYGCDLLNKSFEAEPEEMSMDFAAFNYHELLFLLDTFYGLKPEHDIDNFLDDLIASNHGLAEALLGENSLKFDEAIAELTGVYLDDLHSGYGRCSWRSNDPDGDPELNEFVDLMRSLMYMGYSNQNYFGDSSAFEMAREEAYPEGIPGYEEFGDTAFVTFDSFSVTAIDNDYSEYYDLGIPETLEDCGDDTIRLIQYANAQIQREDSPIKNVVIDLSNNSGGSVSAAVAVLCWYLKECSFALRDTMTGALSIMNYRCDLDVNELVEDADASDSLAGKCRLYCLISPVSFSCGNLVPAIFEDSHQVTLIGQRTGGGSCVVLPCTTASGTRFQISGTMQIAMVKNGVFYNVDQGIEPHIPLTRLSSFYDREGLVELIHNTK